MELLILWGATIIGSFIIDFSTTMRITKGVADEGYKFDNDGLKKMNEQFNYFNTNVKIIRLVPLVNILDAATRVIKVNNAYPFILENALIFDLVKEMNEKEKEYYNKKPTGLRATIISADVLDDIEEIKEILHEEKNPSFTLTYNGNEEHKVIYKIKNDNELIIIERYGVFEKLPDSDTKKFITKTLIDDILEYNQMLKETSQETSKIFEKFHKSQINYAANFVKNLDNDKNEVSDKKEKTLSKIKKS